MVRHMTVRSNIKYATYFAGTVFMGLSILARLCYKTFSEFPV